MVHIYAPLQNTHTHRAVRWW